MLFCCKNTESIANGSGAAGQGLPVRGACAKRTEGPIGGLHLVHARSVAQAQGLEGIGHGEKVLSLEKHQLVCEEVLPARLPALLLLRATPACRSKATFLRAEEGRQSKSRTPSIIHSRSSAHARVQERARGTAATNPSAYNLCRFQPAAPRSDGALQEDGCDGSISVPGINSPTQWCSHGAKIERPIHQPI